MASKMAEEFDLPIKGTRADILNHLLGEDHTALTLEERLGINESAIRRHLDNLEQEGYIEHYFEKAKRGRPKKIFSITSKGRKLFPQKTHLLFSILAEKVSEKHGKEELDNLLSEVAKEFADMLEIENGKKTDKEKLEMLVNSLDKIGFYASLKEKNGKFYIEYRNCIFEEVIEKFGHRLCDMHKKILSEALPETNVEVKKSIGQGDKKCCHLVEV